MREGGDVSVARLRERIAEALDVFFVADVTTWNIGELADAVMVEVQRDLDELEARVDRTPRSELRRIAAVEGVCPICAARSVPAPDNPPVTLAFWECGHIEVDRGRSHACPLDVCGATYAAYAPVADEDVIRADERERLSARVYENGWCPTCGAHNLHKRPCPHGAAKDLLRELRPEGTDA